MKNLLHYECTETFFVNLVDENGLLEEQDGFCIEKETKWNVVNTSNTLTGADLLLESVHGDQWIEISKEQLESNFRKLN